MKTPINGDACHEYLRDTTAGLLSFLPNRDFAAWTEEMKQKLTQLIGLDVIGENACEVRILQEGTEDREKYTLMRFAYESEKENLVPAYLLIPKGKAEKYPLAIVLQGHTTGYHISLGEAKYDRDEAWLPELAQALQAVEHGFAALCIEQRGMGVTRSARYPGPGGVHQCCFTALTALQLGRTVIGERVWDVSRGIDALERLDHPQIDLEKIMILGHSGGGTAAFYAACLEKRIGYAAVSCAFCSYRGSIMDILHCVCNFIPGAMRHFEMEDLAALIIPGRLTVFAGAEDDIFPPEEVRKSYRKVEQIFSHAGVQDYCRLVVMPCGHGFCPDVAWKAIGEEREKLGWQE